MWLRPLALTLLLSALTVTAAAAETPATATGPTSPAEAELLWNDGSRAFAKKDYAEAERKLSRLVDRYPGYSGYLDAHLILGRTRLADGEPMNSLAPLRYYVSGCRSPIAAADGRLWLTRAYLALGRFREAYLSAVEVVANRGKFAGNAELVPLALVLKARALIGLKQDSDAEKSLSDAKAQIGLLQAQDANRLLGEELDGELELKLQACSKLPSPGPLSEDQARDQIERRGSCLLEATTLFRGALQAGNPATAGISANRMRDGLTAYSRACARPPNPPPLEPKDRTPKSSSVTAPSADMLAITCRSKFIGSREILEAWMRPEMKLEMKPKMKPESKPESKSKPNGAPEPAGPFASEVQTTLNLLHKLEKGGA